MKLIYILRHGETEWSKSGRHTGKTDLELTPNGELQAQELGTRLKSVNFEHVFTSPLKRAHRTAEICGLGKVAKIMDDLIEWDYGDYEGRKSVDIRKDNPDWDLFKDGAPGGDSLDSITKRADCILSVLKPLDGNIALFTSGHISRAIVARWIGLEASGGKFFFLSTASVSKLGFEHGNKVVHLWNDTSHLD